MVPQHLSCSLLPIALTLGAAFAGASARERDDLLDALPRSKHSLADGLRQCAKGSEAAISAKFEIEDGKFSLSVYTAEKGLATDAEHNVLKESSGSPEADAWKPEVETFTDVAHVARAAQQLTLMALSAAPLVDVVEKAAKEHAGIVYSITPTLRDRKPMFVVLVADGGKTVELCYDLLSGASIKPKK